MSVIPAFMAEHIFCCVCSNTNSQNLNWVSILFSLDKKNKISGDKAKIYLESFKDVCLKWAEDNGLDAFVNFIRNLLYISVSFAVVFQVGFAGVITLIYLIIYSINFNRNNTFLRRLSYKAVQTRLCL